MARSLVQHGYCVRGCRHRSAPVASLPGVGWLDGCELGQLDRWAPAALAKVDTVVHTAALAHVATQNTAEALAHYRAINTEPTRRLAEMAAAQGVKRFIFLSSIKVNGDQTGEAPFTVTDTPNPSGPYAVSKWEAEQALWEVAERTGLKVVIIRPALVYGPGVKANFAQLSRWVHRGVPLPLAGVDNRRSFLSVFNLVDLIVRCISSPAAQGRVLVAADGEAISTPELVKRLAKAWQVSPRLYSLPPLVLKLAGYMLGRKESVARLTENFEVDITATCRYLDWSPPYSMEDTLARMVDVERKRQGNV